MRRQLIFASGIVLWGVALLTATTVDAQEQRILEAVEAERAPLIETMRELVSIESGSRDPDRSACPQGVFRAEIRRSRTTRSDARRCGSYRRRH